MAYVPGLKHDLFLSYAHEDAAWVTSLQEQLTERLQHRLGYRCDVWQDMNNLRTGQHWPQELETAIRASAAFVAVLSRHNDCTGWCGRELDIFLDEAARSDALEPGGYGRVLKVIKFPWHKNAHLGFYREYQHVEFFETDGRTGREREFKHTLGAFKDAVDLLSFHIAKLFEVMLRGTEKVFVARGASDVVDERERLINEIRARGYALSPPPLGAVAKGLDRKTIRGYLDETRVTVHLLGAVSDTAVREQIDLALEAEKKVVFCLMRGHESATGEQKTLIDEIRENRWNLPKDSWALLENRSAAALQQDLIASLQPVQPAAVTAQNGARLVYLLCDPTTPEDSGFAREMQGQIREKEKIEVELPQLAVDGSPGSRHERLLRECNGLLLYYEKAPDKWYSRNFVDLLTAEHREGRRELKSKAMLVGGREIQHPGLTVIQRRNPFDLHQLEAFLAPLRHGPGGEPGAAEAGC